MIYTNDDYRENVLKCQAGRDSVKQFFTAQELLDLNNLGGKIND